MKFYKQNLTLIVTGLFFCSAAHGQIVIDGTRDADYGPAIAVQTVQTEFGNDDGVAGGSELDAAYATIEGGNLNLLLTGNLESNFNKLNIFIDSVDGGQNVIGPDVDNGGVNPTNDGWAQAHNGLIFDTGFEPDFLVISRNGDAGGPRFDLDFNSVGNDGLVESSLDVFGGTGEGSATGVGASGLSVAFDNSNIAGIAGGTLEADAAAAEAVVTGLELSIPLSALGNPAVGSTILISAQVNGSNHDFLSNQILGGLAAPQGNLGSNGAGEFVDGAGVGLVDFNQFEGDQFFSITVPDSTLLGDFDGDGDVDLDDLDRYNQNIDAEAVGDLAALDLDGDGIVGANDFEFHYSVLVETSNGQTGTCVGDANLDGVVDVVNDAFALVANLNQSATSWAQGDFNADGEVDVVSDAFALVASLGKGEPATSEGQ